MVTPPPIENSEYNNMLTSLTIEEIEKCRDITLLLFKQYSDRNIDINSVKSIFETEIFCRKIQRTLPVFVAN